MGHHKVIADTLIKRAIPVFSKKGYHGAAVHDLTAAMQISSSTLYYSIGSKHALFLKCVEMYVGLSLEKQLQVYEQSVSAYQGIRQIIGATIDAIINEDNSCFDIKCIFELPDDKKMIRILKDGNDDSAAILTNMLDSAVIAGEINYRGDTATLANYILASFAGWRQSYIIHGNAHTVKKMGLHLLRSLKPVQFQDK